MLNIHADNVLKIQSREKKKKSIKLNFIIPYQDTLLFFMPENKFKKKKPYKMLKTENS